MKQETPQRAGRHGGVYKVIDVILSHFRYDIYQNIIIRVLMQNNFLLVIDNHKDLKQEMIRLQEYYITNYFHL